MSNNNDPDLSIAARLNEERGLIVVGPEESASDVFTFGVALVYATNLNKVVPADMCPPEDVEFTLEYDFFGEKIPTMPFKTLIQPRFEAQTVTARLLSSPELIVRYFSTVQEKGGGGSVTFKLCMAGCVLATATVDMGEALKPTVRSLMEQKSITCQGSALMFPSDQTRVYHIKTERNRNSESAASSPQVGFVLSLRHISAFDPSESMPPEMASVEEIEAESKENEGQWKRKLNGTVSDLEEWKLRQKKRFSDQLKQLEAHHNGALAAEWRRREEQRELVFRDKLEEVCKLGDELRAAFAQVREEKRQLTLRENAIVAKEARLKERDLKHQAVSDQLMASNMTRLHRLETENRKLKAELGDGRATKDAVENQRLKVELQKIRTEVGHAASALERCETEKSQLKTQLDTAMANAHKAKERSEDDELVHELIFVKKENDVLKVSINNLQEDLDDLRSSSKAKIVQLEMTIEALRMRSVGPSFSGQLAPESDLDDPNDTAMTTLDQSDYQAMLARRETLIKSGCYGPSDEVIKIIDAKLATRAAAQHCQM